MLSSIACASSYNVALICPDTNDDFITIFARTSPANALGKSIVNIPAMI